MSTEYKQYLGKTKMVMNVVDFAWQVIEMQRTIDAQERQITRLMRIEEDYKKLLDSSVEHGRAMMGNVLKLCMTPGVVEACQASAAEKVKGGE